jgi:hypothetical protein
MYKLIKNSNSIQRLSDGAFIPNDNSNSDYQKYLQWVSLGNSASSAETIEEIKNRLYSEIKAYRDLRKTLGVKVGAYWFHSDDSSRIQQLGLVLLGANIPGTLLWKTMSGDFVQMNQSLAQAIFQTIANSDTAIFAVAEQHRQNVLNSNDPSNYNYKTGFPPVYGE